MTSLRPSIGVTLLAALIAAACSDNEVPNFCGNGRLEVDLGERCDSTIAAGLTGACPTACDDGNPCTTDTIAGEKAQCTATCTHTVDTTLTGCLATCGNGVVDKDETCDIGIAGGKDGACPTSCDDEQACTEDAIEGTGCAAKCKNTAITLTASTADLCCPEGGDATTDPDCSPSCGNKVLEDGEACDTGIASGAGACPTACDDGKACTTDALTGTNCDKKCTTTEIVTAKNGDLCCPASANSETDNDCKAVCGNAVVEEAAGEACDTGITTGVGKCPGEDVDCNDQKACTADQYDGGKGCAAGCTNTDILACSGTAKDGCCPGGCDNNTDKDCSANCGNGVVEKGDGEECDKTIVAQADGFCPTVAADDCDDDDTCTTDSIDGTKDACTAKCIHTAIGASTASKDLCCPQGANNNTDSDCKAVCDNGVFEPDDGETCDDGNGSPTPCKVLADCNDKNDCTTDTLPEGITGNACTVACKNTARTASGTTMDQCCPTGANNNTDKDCPVVCGNSAVETGETCDKALNGGLGGCDIITCNDYSSCTADAAINLDRGNMPDATNPAGANQDCTKVCVHTNDTTGGDACCPPDLASGSADTDCVCGDVTKQGLESCDLGTGGAGLNGTSPTSLCTTSCTTGHVPDGSGGTATIVGSPCAANAECTYPAATVGFPKAIAGQGAATCLTTASAAALAPGVLIPNGYCSLLGCSTAKTPVEAPPNIVTCPQVDPAAPNAVCADLGTVNPAAAGVTACLALCVAHDNCRRLETQTVSGVTVTYRCQTSNLMAPSQTNPGVCMMSGPTF